MCVNSLEASLSLCCSLLPRSHSATHLFQLHQPSPHFDLGDPYCRHLRTEYNSLHDPHLQDYHNRQDNLQNLKKRGLVTKDGKVGLDVGLTNTGLLGRSFQAAGKWPGTAGRSPLVPAKDGGGSSPTAGEGRVERGAAPLLLGACTFVQEGHVGSYLDSSWEPSALVSP